MVPDGLNRVQIEIILMAIIIRIILCSLTTLGFYLFPHCKYQLVLQ